MESQINDFINFEAEKFQQPRHIVNREIPCYRNILNSHYYYFGLHEVAKVNMFTESA